MDIKSVTSKEKLRETGSACACPRITIIGKRISRDRISGDRFNESESSVDDGADYPPRDRGATRPEHEELGYLKFLQNYAQGVDFESCDGVEPDPVSPSS